jgi:predicted Zn-dependent protease
MNEPQTRLTVVQALELAIEHHRAGRLQDAERLYRAILDVQPQHPDANHNLGVLAVGVGKVEAALPLFKKALEARPDVEQFWLSYADGLLRAGQLNAARQVIALARQQGHIGPAIEQLATRIEQTTAQDAQAADLLAQAIAARETGRYSEANVDFWTPTLSSPTWSSLLETFGHPLGERLQRVTFGHPLCHPPLGHPK